jgi:Sulfotransferase family
VTLDRGGPIFVVGSMRSGSTMLRLILDSHPSIAIPPETGFMGAVSATKRIPDWQFGEAWYERLGWSEAELDQRLRRFYDELFRRYAAEQGKSRWGEKTPFHTAHMEQMGRIFPDAAFVGIVRHPGAVASSLRRRFHYGFAEAVTYWSDANRDLLRGGIALGDRFALCRYEDLVRDGEPVLRPLLAFLGEPWALEVTEHHRVQRERGAPRSVEGSTLTSDPVDPGRADAWSATVDDDDRRELRRAGTLAAFLGYDVDPDGSRPMPLPWDRTRIVTGTDLARRRLDAPVNLAPDANPRPPLAEVSVEELAARLVRVEGALARVRSRRAVRVVDAMRRVQHGRSLADVRAAWHVLREAAVGPGR